MYKKLIITLFLCTITLFSYSGIDDMNQKQSGQSPVERKDHSDDDDDHHGGGHNAPFESFTILAGGFILIVIYGIYHLRNEHKKT